MRPWAVWLLAACVARGVPASAQVAEIPQNGSWVELGLAYGTRGIAVDGGILSDSASQESLAGTVLVGTTVGSHVSIGAGAMLWGAAPDRRSGASTAIVGLVKAYLGRMTGLNVRLGVGYYSQRRRFLGADIDFGTFSSIFGVAYDLTVGHSSFIALFSNFLYVPSGTAIGVVSNGVSATLVQIGFSIVTY